MPRALITDVGGTRISAPERSFLRAFDPLGIILFRRNVADPDQVSDLVASFRDIVGRDEAPVMIDQEGGRVARLGKPHWWPGLPPAAIARGGERAAWLAGRLLAHDMAPLGIDVTCAPSLDLRLAGMDDVIGDRAFSDDPDSVSDLGAAFIDGLGAGGVQATIKHLPGHGRVTADPHEGLPRVDTGLAVLREQDFIPFRRLAASPFGIVAHVVYTAVDSRNPASASPDVVRRIIRDELGFAGVLLSDAIDMAALSGPHEARARSCIAAGIDVVMHCNQALEVRERVAAATPELAGGALERVMRAAAARRPPQPGFDPGAARAELARLVATP